MVIQLWKTQWKITNWRRRNNWLMMIRDEIRGAPGEQQVMLKVRAAIMLNLRLRLQSCGGYALHSYKLTAWQQCKNVANCCCVTLYYRFVLGGAYFTQWQREVGLWKVTLCYNNPVHEPFLLSLGE